MAKPLKVITILFATIFSVAFISVAVLLLIPTTRQYIADRLSPYATEQEDTNTNNEQLQQLTASAEELQNLLNTYVNQNYQQQQQINSLRQQLANLEINQGAEFEQLQQQKQQLQTELESALQNVTTLTTNLQQYQQLANQLQTQITAIQTQLDATLEDYESANLQIAQLQSLLDTTNQTINLLNQQVSDYQTQIAQLQNAINNQPINTYIERTPVYYDTNEHACYVGIKISNATINKLITKAHNLVASPLPDASEIYKITFEYYGKTASGINFAVESSPEWQTSNNNITYLSYYRINFDTPADHIGNGYITQLYICGMTVYYNDANGNDLGLRRYGSNTIDLIIDLDPTCCQIITI